MSLNATRVIIIIIWFLCAYIDLTNILICFIFALSKDKIRIGREFVLRIRVRWNMGEWHLWANDFISSRLDGSLSRWRSYGIISFHRGTTGKRIEFPGWIIRRVNCFHRTLSVPVCIHSRIHMIIHVTPSAGDSLERERTPFYF